MKAECVLPQRYAGVAELADAPDLGSGGRPCRFNSCHPHFKGFSQFCEKPFLRFDINFDINRVMGI